MTMALRLAQQGKQVTLFEAAPSLGGVASAWQLGDVIWDRHYHVTLKSDKYLLSILRELDLECYLQWATTRTGFYSDSHFYSLSNTIEFLKFPLIGFIDKLRLAATIFYASRVKDWKALEDILVADWLRKWSGLRVLEKIWLPLLRAKLGDNYLETSAAFIWAVIARMYAARRSGMKKEVFGYVSGGYSRTIERFAKTLRDSGVRCQLGQPVRTIHSSEPAKVSIQLADGTDESFHQVVMTTAAPLTARLCPQLTEREKSQLSSIKYQGIICASLLLRDSLSGFYITNITDDWVPFTAVIEMSALVDRKEFGGRALVYLPKYLPSDAPDFELTDAQIQNRFIEALKRMYPRFTEDSLLCFRVSRVKYLLPIPTVKYSSHLPKVATSIQGIHVVSSANIVNGTLNVNATVELAERTAASFANCLVIDRPRSEVWQYDSKEADRQPVAGSRQ
jgi:protoporphyrinogen oxidase